MAFRRRTPFRRGTRKRAIWINIPFSTTFAEAVGNGVLLLPEDWEAQFTSEANESAVLRAVVGVLVWQQTANGTLGGNAFWGLYISDKDATVVPTFTVSGMSDVDWLHVDAFGTMATAAGTNAPLQRQNISIKARRRLKSRDAIYICGQFGADAVTPSANIMGILRFLVARD